MKKLTLILLLCASVFMHENVMAQLTARQVIPYMQRGINMGNTLDAPNEGEWGNGPVQEYYFDDYKAAGFQTVRIPVTWDNHTSWDAPYYPVDGAWMNRVEEIVDWGLSRGLYIILNMHHENWFFDDYNAGEARFFSIWWQIIDRFKNKSDKLIFEILNEPVNPDNMNQLEQWQVDAVNEGVLNMIREQNPTRIVIYGGKQWCSASDLMNAAIPNGGDPYLMGYYHSYDPYFFAHECRDYNLSQEGRQHMWDQFWAVNNWSQNTGIPVLLGEFGCRKCVDYDNMIEHYTINVTEAKKYGIAYCAWDDGGWFEIYKRDSRSWWDGIKNVIGGGDNPVDPCDNATPIVVSGTTRIEAENFCDSDDVETEDCKEGTLNVGWINPGSWMAYRIDVQTAGTYTVKYRVASLSDGGNLQIEAKGGSPVYGTKSFGATGDWQTWTTVEHQIDLVAGVQTIAIAAITGGWNINWFELSSGDPGTKTLTASTQGNGTVNPSSGTYPTNSNVSITATAASGWSFHHWEGDASGSDNPLNLTMNDNKNIIAVFEEDSNPVEFILQAEEYSNESGITIINNSYIGYIDNGDWISFDNVNVPESGQYTVTYRVAAEWGGGVIKLEQNAGTTLLGQANVSPTGGWENWTEVSHTANLNAGSQSFGFGFVSGPYNLDWIKFSKGTSKSATVAIDMPTVESKVLSLYPNPANDVLNIAIGNTTEAKVTKVYDVFGKLILAIPDCGHLNQINISDFKPGIYFVTYGDKAKKFIKR